MPLIGDFGGNTMKTVIFQTGKAVLKFGQRDVTERLIGSESEYDSDRVTQLLELISTDYDETILSTADHHYFGYVALDLIRAGVGTAICNICGKIYDAGKLMEFAVG